MDQDPYRQPSWPDTRVFLGPAGDLTIEVELPGISSQDLELTFEGMKLRIACKGGRTSDSSVRDHNPYQANHRSAFESLVEIPVGFQPLSARANYLDGVLRVVVPKEDTSPSPQIPPQN